MSELTQQEIRAIDMLLAENWESFGETAGQYLSPDEIEALGEKLQKLTE